ncbi:GGDEF domain-containing response regulator [Marinomonas epiphytica]
MKCKILVVEDSPVVLKVLKHLLTQKADYEPVLCSSYREAQSALEVHDDLYAAIVDLNLPDAENGEVVDLVLAKKIPCIVLTGNFNDQLRESLLNKGVLDYITKDSRYSFNHVIKVVDRLKKNQGLKVLVAEDSTTSRHFIRHLLEQYRFSVVEAENGQEALAKLEADDSIKMLITDYNMPLINGYELVRMLRYNSRFQNLVIIGLSAEGDSSLSAKFIKSGANDFLKKPFYHEEFHCRVVHNLEAQEMLETIRDLANLDALTKLYNRRYLFEEGEKFYRKSVNLESGASVVMLDIDHFKSKNDAYGHVVGDMLLESFANTMRSAFPNYLASRFGGEEFCLIADCSGDALLKELNNFLVTLRNMEHTEAKINLTCSVGVCGLQGKSFEEALNIADGHLYEAKRLGRDQVIGD